MISDQDLDAMTACAATLEQPGLVLALIAEVRVHRAGAAIESHRMFCGQCSADPTGRSCAEGVRLRDAYTGACAAREPMGDGDAEAPPPRRVVHQLCVIPKPDDARNVLRLTETGEWAPDSGSTPSLAFSGERYGGLTAVARDPLWSPTAWALACGCGTGDRDCPRRKATDETCRRYQVANGADAQAVGVNAT